MVSFTDMWSYVEDKALSRRCPGFASNASHGSPQPPQPSSLRFRPKEDKTQTFWVASGAGGSPTRIVDSVRLTHSKVYPSDLLQDTREVKNQTWVSSFELINVSLTLIKWGLHGLQLLDPCTHGARIKVLMMCRFRSVKDHFVSVRTTDVSIYNSFITTIKGFIVM